MEQEFFDLYERHEPLALEVGHNGMADWCLQLHDITGGTLKDRGEPVISLQECDRSVLFAKAYIELTEYLSEKRGGY